MLCPPVTVCVLRVSGPYSSLCAVRMFYRMCELSPAPDTCPLLFLSSRSGRLRPVLKSQFVSVRRARLRAANVPQAHLFRVISFVGEGHLGPFRWVFLGNLSRSSGISAQTRINVI